MRESHPITLDDLIEAPWHGASAPEFSADGRRVAYVDGGRVGVVDVDATGPPKFAEGTAPRWSPNGNRLAFLRGEPAQLWLREDDDTERPLTRASNGVTGYAWSFDGLQVASIGPHEKPDPPDGDHTPVGSIVEVHRRPLPAGHALMLIDVESGLSRLAARTDPGVSWSGPEWSPDGVSLALVEDIAEATGCAEQCLLAIVDLATGRVRYPVGRGRRQVGRPRWSPDGRKLAVPYSPHDFVHPYRYVLGVIDVDGGEVTCLAADEFIDDVNWHQDNRTVYRRGGRGSTRQVLRVNTATGEVRRLTDLPGLHDHCRLSPDGTRIVATYQTPMAPAELVLLSADGRERRVLTAIADRSRRFRLADAEVVRWRARDGLQLEGIVVKPPGFEAGRCYPTVVDLHCGPVAGGMAAFIPEYHWLAAQGYLVFGPDFRGGQVYGWCGPPDYLRLDVDDVMSGLDHLVEEGLADPDRLGVHGFSYGASLAAQIIGRTGRFVAAVVAGGMYHPEVAYGSGPGGLGGNAILAAELGGRPWEVPESYRLASPLGTPPRDPTPTLILHGERDGPAEAEMLYTWLRQGGAEAEYVMYRGEGHVIALPEHRRDYWRRALAWFVRHLT